MHFITFQLFSYKEWYPVKYNNKYNTKKNKFVPETWKKNNFLWFWISLEGSLSSGFMRVRLFISSLCLLIQLQIPHYIGQVVVKSDERNQSKDIFILTSAWRCPIICNFGECLWFYYRVLLSAQFHHHQLMLTVVFKLMLMLLLSKGDNYWVVLSDKKCYLEEDLSHYSGHQGQVPSSQT